MIKKNIMGLILLSSSLFAAENNNLEKLEPETTEEITLDFSFGLNEPNKAAFVPRASSNNLYNEISKNLKELTKTFGSTFYTNLLPLGFQLSYLSNLLKTDEKFVTLVKTNTEKLINLAIPLIADVINEAAKVAGYQENKIEAKV